MTQHCAASTGSTAVPRHIAVIMDGNGRWARRRGMPRVAGHRRGVDTVRTVLQCCERRGVDYLTLFAFSSENWRRPVGEVRFLMDLLAKTLRKDINTLHDNGVRLRVIGDISFFRVPVLRMIEAAVQRTASNRGVNLTIAINYGGQWDLVEAARSLAGRVAAGELAAAAITPECLAERLSTRDLPEPDLFIRTGGEQRISNFLLWQLAYTELYFTPTLWPEFDEQCFDDAVTAYRSRQRRFGQTGEQLVSNHA